MLTGRTDGNKRVVFPASNAVLSNLTGTTNLKAADVVVDALIEKGRRVKAGKFRENRENRENRKNREWGFIEV